MAKNAEVEASYSGRIRATKIFRTIICVLLCIISVFPFYLMIVNSTLDSNTIKTVYICFQVLSHSLVRTFQD